jgi:hypothetical protein
MASKDEQADLESAAERQPLLQALKEESEVAKDVLHAADKGRVLQCKLMAKRGARKLTDSIEVTHTIWDRLFCKDRNRKFGDNAELAVRAAFFATILGMPYLTPTETHSVVETVREEGFLNWTIFVMFLFTVYKTVGDTIAFAYYGIIGTVLSAVSVWMMHGFCARGQYPGSPPWHFWFGAIWGTVFVLGTLWLNLDKNTKIFCLSFYVWHWMNFMNPTPGVSDNYSLNFTLHQTGTAVNEIFSCGIGCALAILCSLLPFPLWALEKAKDTSTDVVERLGVTMHRCTTYLAGSHKNSTVTDRIKHDMKDLEGLVSSIKGLIASSWWECLGFGRSQKVRLSLGTMADAISNLYDVFNALLVCASEEEFGDNHTSFMTYVKVPLGSVVEISIHLFDLILVSSLDGTLSDEEKDELAEARATLQDEVKTLEKHFNDFVSQKTRAETNSSWVHERVVCLCVTRFARIVDDCANDIVSDTGVMSPRKLLSKETMSKDNVLGALGALKTTTSNFVDPAVLFSKDRLLFVLRNGTSLLTCFFIGYHMHNVNPTMYHAYNADMASTVAVLLNSQQVASVQNNLTRLQGLVLGTVIGQLAFGMFGWCTVSGVITLGVFVFMWSLVCLFTYYDSVQHSGLAILLAVFGLKGIIIQPCSNIASEKSQTYFMIVAAVTAITVIVGVDTILSPTRASDLAHQKRREAYASIVTAVKQLFDVDQKHIEFNSQDVLGTAASAQELALLADQEPRVWRVPFRMKLFSDFVHMIRQLRFSLAVMEVGVAKDHRHLSEKSAAFELMLKSPSIQRLAKCLLDKMEQIEKLSAFLEWESEGHMPGWTGKRLRDEPALLTQGYLKDLDIAAAEAEANLDFSSLKGASELWSLEDDPACELSVVVSSSRAMIKQLGALQHSILGE